MTMVALKHILSILSKQINNRSIGYYRLLQKK